MLIVGYIVISPFPFLFDVKSRVITIPFRGFVGAFSLLILYYYRRNWHISSSLKWLLLFWLMYLFRMTYDLYFGDIVAKLFEYKIQYLEYAIFVTLLPSLSIFSLPRNVINFRKLLNLVYYILFFLLLGSIVHLPMRGGTTSGILSMYYISYGHAGTTLSFLSIFLFVESKNRLRWLWKVLYILGFLLGLLIIYLASARSPVLALVLMLLVYFINREGLKKGVLILIAIVALCFLSFFLFNFFTRSQLQSAFFVRTGEMLKGNMNGRWIMYQQAFSDFLHHPVIGRCFLLQNGVGSGIYPHNIILEVAMAIGCLGLICFGGWLYSVFKVAMKILKNGEGSWTVYLAIQYFVLALTSYCIFTNNYFWYFTAIVIWMGDRLKNIKPVSTY